jgi:hypothetical protein
MTSRVQRANSGSDCNFLVHSSAKIPIAEVSSRDWNRCPQERKKYVYDLISFANLGRSGVVRSSILLCSVGVLLCFSLTKARCQVLSRQATVLLTARVESVGISAGPDGELGQSETDTGLDATALMIKTSWAVPPNFTRLRLIRTISCECAGMLPRKIPLGSKFTPRDADTLALGIGGVYLQRSSLLGTTDAEFGGSSEIFWTESSGSTSQPRAREDEMLLPGRVVDVLGKSTRDPKRSVTFLLEAF